MDLPVSTGMAGDGSGVTDGRLVVSSTHREPPQELVAAGLLSLGVGIVVLAGWASGLDVLASVIPGQITMKPNTAISFAVFGIALLLIGRPDRTGRRAGRALAGIVGLFVAVIGAQYMVNADFGIDQLLFRERPGAVGTVTPGRMSPQAAIAFIALVLAVVMVRHPARRRLVLVLLCLPAALGAINALELGAAAHVTKPIDVPEFMAVLAETMAEGPGVADVA